MKKIREDTDVIVIELSLDEVDMCISGIRETLEEVDGWEIGTRTGFEADELRNMLREMVRMRDEWVEKRPGR